MIQLLLAVFSAIRYAVKKEVARRKLQKSNKVTKTKEVELPKEAEADTDIVEANLANANPVDVDVIEKTTLEKILALAKVKNYSVFEGNSKDHNLNLWFIRSEDPTVDVFNDKCVVFWKDLIGTWKEVQFDVTVDPGAYWMTKEGYKAVAILAEGQYKSTYKVDIHRKGTSSAHTALCQRLGTVKVYRDGNKDLVHDFDVPTEIGSFGINCHRPTNTSEKTGSVGPSSAGCLVWSNRATFDNLESKYDKSTFMGLCRTASNLWGNKFTITLCTQKELDSIK